MVTLTVRLTHPVVLLLIEKDLLEIKLIICNLDKKKSAVKMKNVMLQLTTSLSLPNPEGIPMGERDYRVSLFLMRESLPESVTHPWLKARTFHL